MYPKEFFIERFADLSNQELLEKFSMQDLSAEAHAAILDILRGRGMRENEIEALSRQAHKAALRQTLGTTECDYCKCSAKIKPVFDEGQRFCSINCLNDARLSEAAVDLTAAQIQQRAVQIRNGPCPICQRQGSPVEVRYFYRVTSFFISPDLIRAINCAASHAGAKKITKRFGIPSFLAGGAFPGALWVRHTACWPISVRCLSKPGRPSRLRIYCASPKWIWPRPSCKSRRLAQRALAQ